MKKTQIALLALAGCMILFVPNAVHANGDWLSAWRGTYVDICPDLATTSCTLCHDGAPALNAYGAEMGSMNFVAIEGIDSDGDGRTNGEEILQDCTLPGDSDSVPVEFDSWGAIKVLFR